MLRDAQDISVTGTGEDFSSVLVSSGGASSESAPGCVALANKLRPTLGLGWYHIVTTRMLMFVCATDGVSVAAHDDGTDRANVEIIDSSVTMPAAVHGQRYCSISKSPMCRLQVIPYNIGPTGILGL